MTSTAIKYYPFFVLAVVEVVTRAEMTSCFVGVSLACLGGGLMQMHRAESKDLSLTQAASEWGLSGMLGFMVHAAAMKAFDSEPWMIWSACVFAGLTGSEGLKRYMEKHKDA